MNYLGEAQGRVETPKILTQPHVIQDQSHLMALTSEWGHSVFEVNLSICFMYGI